VFLDLTALGSEHIRARFPRTYENCLRYGVDLGRQPAPVHPAAHYAMGGVRTNLDGRTNLEHLYAAGEAACTGVHGANRLASNSLLEGVVFGMRAGRAMREARQGSAKFAAAPEAKRPKMPEDTLRSLTWRNCGIVRTGAGLSEALTQLNREACTDPCVTVADYELRNMHAFAQLVAASALLRCESRGGHYRADFPSKSEAFQKHSVVSLAGVRFE
jgi:L-aspartate oxidase